MLDRTIKPIPSGKIEFKLPEINIFTLNNSLKIYHVKKSTLPIVQLYLITPAGSIYDNKNKYGSSKLTSMLIDEGAGNLSGLEISDRIDMLGTILNISSNKEFITLSLLTLKNNLDKSLEIFSLIIQSPNFNKSDFDRELQRLQNQTLQLNDEPSYVASSEFVKTIYQSTPFEFPSNGKPESVKLISNHDIKNFYSKRFLPNNSFFIVVGNIGCNELEKQLNKYFAEWETKNNSIDLFDKIKQTSKNIIFINKPDAAQSEIRVGHFSKGRNSEDFYARTILNTILGGQFSSRINLNLREDKGFTYGANSNYGYNKLGSTFTVSTSVKSDNTVDAVKEILFELENVKSTITNEELVFSKSYLIRRYPSLFETYSQVATNISLLPIFDLNPDYFQKYIDHINCVTLEDVTKAANENILSDQMLIVVVGNKSIIKDDLKKLSELIKSDYEEKS